MMHARMTTHDIFKRDVTFRVMELGSRAKRENDKDRRKVYYTLQVSMDKTLNVLPGWQAPDIR